MLKWALILLGCYLFVVIIMFLMQRSLQYFPDKTLLSPADFQLPFMQVVKTKTADGLEINHWYTLGKNPNKPTVILFHGNAGHIGARGYKALPFIENGYGFVLAGYRGYSGNEGQPTEIGLYHDARAIIDWLKTEQGLENQDIIVFGESLGSGIAVQMATEYDVRAILLEAPYSSTDDIAAHWYPFLPVRILMKDKFQSKKKIQNIKAPLFIYHGTQDRTIPIRYGQRLYELAPEPKAMLVIDDGNHTDIFNNEIFEAFDNFLKKHSAPL